MSAKGKNSKKDRSGGSKKRRKKSPTRQKHSGSVFPCGVISISSQGYGFVETPEGRFYIPSKRTNGAMDRDLVRVRPSSNWQPRSSFTSEDGHSLDRKTPTASVERVLERAHTSTVGMFVSLDGLGFVIPQDKRMNYLIRAHRGSCNPQERDIVLLRFDVYPTKREMPSGHVEKILGHEGDPGILEEIVAAKHGLETQFSPAALKEAAEQKLDVEEALQEPDRLDLRDRFVLTIDPVDAKDFDDALSVEYVDDLICLGVHIADVSNYVRWGSSLDLDARRRATSVYFPNKVIPMLPEALSNNLCSLKPGEDRLAFTVDIYLDKDCVPLRSEMYPSVIRSSLRLDYGNVQAMFDGKLDYPNAQARETLTQLRQIGKTLLARRKARGSLDFESSELKVLLDDEGLAYDVIERQRSEATSLVEEAMILANETVAAYMLKTDSSMIYRVHDAPSPSSLEEITPALREMGVLSPALAPTNKSIQALIDSVRDKPESIIVNSLVLRSMKQALYRDKFTSHFGLASLAYTHFTSPIRRYPDLMAHRFLRARLYKAAKDRGKISSKAKRPEAVENVQQMSAVLAQICEHSSVMERTAELASNEMLEIKVCEYMEQFVGQKFDALIVSVLSSGFFVRLKNGCEGLVPVRSLSAYYEFDEEKRKLVDYESPSRRSFSLGQRVQVVLLSTGSNLGFASGARSRLTFGLV